MNISEMVEIDFDWPAPKNKDAGIGVVGAGLVVNNAHLPAYRDAGFRVAAIYDAREDAARRTADRFGIPQVCRSADELVERRDVQFVDIAVPPDGQFAIAKKAIMAGKHLLCQKPLSESFDNAVQLVEMAEKAGTQLAVNQQMRWTPAIRYAKLLLQRGYYGEATECQFDLDLWSNWDWAGQRPRVEYFFNSIHYIDVIRFLLGEPKRVIASSAVYPGQKAIAETRSYTILEYSDSLRAVILSNHNNWSGRPRMIMRLNGLDGRSEASLGMKDYPLATPDTFSFVSRTGGPGWALERTFEEPWLPTAFARPMADLMCCAESGGVPITAGRDNLGTLRIIEAAYRSIAEGRRVNLAELEGAASQAL